MAPMVASALSAAVSTPDRNDFRPCPVTELPRNGCSHCRPAPAEENPSRTRSLSAPTMILLEGNRPNKEGTISYEWRPYGNGLTGYLDPSAGDLHIIGAFCAKHLLQILRTCPDVHRVTFAPTAYKPELHDEALMDYIDRGIAVQTRRIAEDF